VHYQGIAKSTLSAQKNYKNVAYDQNNSYACTRTAAATFKSSSRTRHAEGEKMVPRQRLRHAEVGVVAVEVVREVREVTTAVLSRVHLQADFSPFFDNS
jgi:hypothetical protein